MLIRIFQAATVLFAAIAGYFFWTGNTDGTFVAAVLAASAFFLNIRFQIKERTAERAAREREADASD